MITGMYANGPPRGDWLEATSVVEAWALWDQQEGRYSYPIRGGDGVWRLHPVVGVVNAELAGQALLRVARLDQANTNELGPPADPPPAPPDPVPGPPPPAPATTPVPRPKPQQMNFFGNG